MAHSLERHFGARLGWLRAAVLGANDGIVSTASLMVGVASASTSKSAVLLTGLAGLVAGAMSMAAGELISVSSQADAERADLAREAQELRTDPAFEREELAGIYQRRGLKLELAREVADALMAKDALGAHARDELNLSELTQARPLQAASSSAIAFAGGALVPVGAAIVAPHADVTAVVVIASLAALAWLGAFGARAGEARLLRPVVRVVFWGAMAMAVTAAAGFAFHATL